MFVTFALINAWNYPLQIFPRAVNDTAQAVTAVARIRDFLLLEEADDQVVTLDQSAGCEILEFLLNVWRIFRVFLYIMLNFVDKPVQLQEASLKWSLDGPPILRKYTNVL